VRRQSTMKSPKKMRARRPKLKGLARTKPDKVKIQKRNESTSKKGKKIRKLSLTRAETRGLKTNIR